MKIGVVGASGYAGGELLRLLSGHPEFEAAVITAGSNAGEEITAIHPQLSNYAGRKFESSDPSKLNGLDLVFTALPHGESAKLISQLDPNQKVVDLGADFRLRNSHSWKKYYNESYAGAWLYAIPELPGKRAAIAAADRVANPGCYATGAIALIRPLVDAGLIPADFPMTLPAVSGYSGGGRSMIEAYEAGTAPPFEAYALGLQHKHVPEIMQHTGLRARPLFLPSVGNFRQGMLVNLPLHLDALPGRVRAADLEQALRDHYARVGSTWVTVESPTEDGKLEPTALNDTNRLELRVYPQEAHRHALLVARLDNLGKGASGAAVQNIRLMLGL